jgi:hypothetical protein
MNEPRKYVETVYKITPVNDEPTSHEILLGAATMPVLELDVEQHVYIIQVPLTVVLVGHVNVSEH